MTNEAQRSEASDSTDLLGGWRPIGTAPKGGQLIDLWCISKDVEFVPERGGVRFTDCNWHEADAIFPISGWIRTLDDGNWDLIDGPAMSEFGCPAWTPTHWREIPEPPNNQIQRAP